MWQKKTLLFLVEREFPKVAWVCLVGWFCFCFTHLQWLGSSSILACLQDSSHTVDILIVVLICTKSHLWPWSKLRIKQLGQVQDGSGAGEALGSMGGGGQ